MVKVITKDEFNRSVETSIYGISDFKYAYDGTVFPVKVNPVSKKIDPSLLPTVNSLGGDISPGETQTIDSIIIAAFVSEEYTINIWSEDFSQTKSFKIIATRTGPSSVADQLYAKSGNADIEVSAVIEDDEFRLKIKNNTLVELLYSVNKDF